MATILVWDCDKHLRLLYAFELREEGHEVLLAANESEAIHHLQTRHPDLVVMDIVSGRLAGSGDVVTVLQQRVGLPVILNTSYDDSIEDIFLRLVDACITKSSDLSELKDKIRELLAQSRGYQRKEAEIC